jgi:hypothetical protein
VTKLALIQIGLQHYAVPISELAETLGVFDRMRKVSYRYESGYVYWYDNSGDTDINVSVVPVDRISDSEPDKKSAPTATPTKPKAKDERLIAAPSDEPIAIGTLPPLREFVNEHRDDEELA